MSDREIRQDVLDELEFDPRVQAPAIGVAVDGHVVSLTGHVESLAEKGAVLEAVRRVRGVKAIAEEIDVRYPADKKTADDQIAKRAIDILAWDSVAPKEGLQITVHDGWLTLEGEVTWHFERQAAEQAVRKLSGVRGIINGIRLKGRADSQEIKKRIEEALRRHADVEARGIRVRVDGAQVTLQGQVDNWVEREAVEKAAWSVPGVLEVRDDLTIGQ